MKLSVKKLRRSTTVIGGTFLGLGIAAAMATPALACHPQITPVSSCVNPDGSWVVQWKVTPSDSPDIQGHVSNVVAQPSGTLTGIVGDTPEKQGTSFPAEGTQTLSKDVHTAKIVVTGVFDTGNGKITDTETGKAHKPTEACKPTDNGTPPSDTPPNNTPPNNAPPATVPNDEVAFVYHETCTTLTVGVQVPKTNKAPETATFKPSTGASKTVTAKPGETETVDFPASKNLSVTAALASAPGKGSKINYTAPKNCSSPAATPSTTPPALAITGSSSTPIAAGAVALVLVGGGAFFMARRRKMKFTA